jgi:hypothetical protein
LNVIYDKFYNVLYYKQQKSTERNDSRMDLKSFQLFIGSLASWAKIESTEATDDERQFVVAQNFFHQLFQLFDHQHNSSLSLQVNYITVIVGYTILIIVLRMSLLALDLSVTET